MTTDKDRLDWLDSHSFAARCSDAGCYVVTDCAGIRRNNGTIREAIDSAMAAERSSVAPGAFGEGETK